MRVWIFLFMVTLALFSPLLRSSLRVPASIRGAFPYNWTRLHIPFSNYSQPTLSKQYSTMAASESGVSMPSSTQSDKGADQAKADTSAETPLPELSAEDFRIYNRLATMMDAYHNHFRHTWTMLYKAATTGTRPAGLSMRQYISYGLQLCRSLTIHHTIEEEYVFPELAQRMPIFGDKDLLITQHQALHVGLVKMEAYLRECLSGEKELRMEEMKTIMGSFGDVLWTHLDLEVKQLQADSMRRYWTKEEILGMNW